jgi:hypothetical protein
VYLFAPIHATCPNNLIFLDLIVLILLSKEYKSRKSHLDLNLLVKEKISTVMAKHYEADSKALDLSRLHTSPDLMENCPVPLFSPSIMTMVLDMTMENVPDLRALDLSNNNLSAPDSLILLALRFPKLRILHIGRYLTRHMDELDCLGGLHLEELVLQGNPSYGKYQDKDSYVS